MKPGHKVGVLTILGLAIAAYGLLGCSLVEDAFHATMQNVRDLPPEAPTPGWEGILSNFMYTLTIGAVGGGGLYSGVIRPRRIAKEKKEKDKMEIELPKPVQKLAAIVDALSTMTNEGTKKEEDQK